MADPQKERGFTSIANELLEAILKADLSKRQLTVLLAFLRESYGWSRKEAKFSARLAARLTGIKQPHCVTTINELLEANILATVKPSSGPSPATYRIQKNYDQWAPFFAQSSDTKTVSLDNEKRYQNSIASDTKTVSVSDTVLVSHQRKDLKKDLKKKKSVCLSTSYVSLPTPLQQPIPDRQTDFFLNGYKVFRLFEPTNEVDIEKALAGMASRVGAEVGRGRVEWEDLTAAIVFAGQKVKWLLKQPTTKSIDKPWFYAVRVANHEIANAVNHRLDRAIGAKYGEEIGEFRFSPPTKRKAKKA